MPKNEKKKPRWAHGFWLKVITQLLADWLSDQCVLFSAHYKSAPDIIEIDKAKGLDGISAPSISAPFTIIIKCAVPLQYYLMAGSLLEWYYPYGMSDFTALKMLERALQAQRLLYLDETSHSNLWLWQKSFHPRCSKESNVLHTKKH